MNETDNYSNQQVIPLSETETLPQENRQGLSMEDKMRLVEMGNETFHKIIDTYAECKRVEAQADMVREWSKVEITKTVAKFKSCQEFMYRTFGERDYALKKDYALLDKGMENNDKELVLMALQNISNIVTKSPLEDLEQLARLYDDPSQPVVLDF